MRLLAASLALMLAAAGCHVPIAHLTAAATAPGPTGLTRSMGHHTGRSCRWWVFGVPVGLPQIDEALNDALARGQGRLLRDVTISSDHTLYFLFGQNCYAVTGEVIA